MADIEAGVWIDGQHYTDDDLTLGDECRVSELARQLAPNEDLDEATQSMLLAAFVCVVKQKTDPSFTIEQALEMKRVDFAKPETKKRPPRKAQ